MRREVAARWLLAALVLSSTCLIPALLANRASALTPHAPIRIERDDQFVTSNGVIGGTGTSTDPYVIGGWEIDAYSNTGIHVLNTTAHFVIRDLAIHAVGRSHFGVHLQDVANGRIENVTARYARSGAFLERTQNVTVVGTTVFGSGMGLETYESFAIGLMGNELQSTGVGVFLATSSNVTVSGNNISGSELAIYVPDYGITASNLTFQNNDMWPPLTVGVSVHRVRGLSVADNRIVRPQAGIQILGGDSVFAQRNIVLDATYLGIEISGSSLNVTANVVSGVSDGPGLRADRSSSLTARDNLISSKGGITMYGASDVVLIGNRLTGGGLVIGGDSPSDFRSLTVGANNTVNGRPFVFYRQCIDVVLDAVPAAQVLLIDCQRVLVRGLTISNMERGIVLVGVQDAVVASNHLEHTAQGIRLVGGANITVERNNMTGTSSPASIGVYVWDTVGLAISANTIRNPLPILLYNTSDTRIFRNNFIAIGDRVHVIDNAVGTRWDDVYPIGGNYWSDYVGPDACAGPSQDDCTGGDGFGDRPHTFFPGLEDRYPLVRPWGISEGLPVPIVTMGGDPLWAGAWNWFSGASSYDPNGSVARWAWYFGDGGTEWGPVAHHAFMSLGAHTVTLTVWDESGISNSTTRIVTVIAPSVPPRAYIRAYPIDPLYIGQDVSFDGSSSETDYGSIETYAWNFGDGTTASGVQVRHAYLAPGTYTVVLTVGDAWGGAGTGSLELRVSDPSDIPLRPYEHLAGFRVPVPAQWSLAENQVFEEIIVETVLRGPDHDGFTTNILIESDRDPTVREDNAYLRELVDGALGASPGAYISDEPTYRMIAGHLGVVFSVTNPTSHPTFIQRIAIVVSESHGRYWLLVLSAHVRYSPIYNATFDRMVDGFEITSQPVTLGGGAAAAVVAAVGGLAAAICIAMVLSRGRKSAPPVPLTTPPFPSMTRPPYPPSPSVMGGVQFCVSCGTPAPRSYRFCVRCGVAHAPARAQALESVETTPAGSGTPPAPPPPP